MRISLAGLIIVLATVLCVGCETKDKSTGAAGQPKPAASVVTRENYLRIHVGMRADELELMFGKPTSTNDFYQGLSDTKDWHWKDGDKRFYVVLTLKNGEWVVKDKTQYNLN